MSDLAARCLALQELQVRRKFFIGLATKQGNAAGALVRRALGWTPDGDDTASIVGRAARIVAWGLSGTGRLKPEDEEVAAALGGDLAVIRDCLAPVAAARHQIELEMARQARRLPVAPWAAGVAGFGERALAVLVGEAGDLSAYATRDKLWRRLGLAPYEGKAGKTWRLGREGALTAEQWTDYGYSPRRRAQVYALVDEPLFRHQTHRAGPYRAVYDRRRARTAETHPDWTKARSHADALRIMTKELVSDLWSEWRRAAGPVPEGASVFLPAAELVTVRSLIPDP